MNILCFCCNTCYDLYDHCCKNYNHNKINTNNCPIDLDNEETNLNNMLKLFNPSAIQQDYYIIFFHFANIQKITIVRLVTMHLKWDLVE
jgi:hypothetical protein